MGDPHADGQLGKERREGGMVRKRRELTDTYKYNNSTKQSKLELSGLVGVSQSVQTKKNYTGNELVTSLLTYRRKGEENVQLLTSKVTKTCQVIMHLYPNSLGLWQHNCNVRLKN